MITTTILGYDLLFSSKYDGVRFKLNQPQYIHCTYTYLLNLIYGSKMTTDLPPKCRGGNINFKAPQWAVL